MKKRRRQTKLETKIKEIFLGKGDASAHELVQSKAWVPLLWNLVLGLLCICFCLYLVMSWRQYSKLSEKKQKLNIEIQQLQKETDDLRKQKKALETKEEIEKVARRELGLVKPGEIPYVK